ncbi:MAG TPA: MarC family protein [Phycisphaerae bacterium]|nr:MarC family protein [Phycisphaerae bacterium]
MADWEFVRHFAQATIGLIAILDPVGCLPGFDAMTLDVSKAERRFMYRVTGIVSLITVLAMALVGQFVLDYVFRIRFESFMVGGGLLLVVVGVKNIIFGEAMAAATDCGLNGSKERREQLIMRAVCPLACPLLVGPGSIVTSMLIVQDPALGVGWGLIAIALAFSVVIMVLNWGHLIMGIFGRFGPLIVARITMIFVTAIGVEFMVRGLKALFFDCK